MDNAQATDRNRNLEIAETIRAQLGRMALMMLGAKDLIAIPTGTVHEGPGLRFRIRGCETVNMIEITLQPSDTYSIGFFKVTRARRSLDLVRGCGEVREIAEFHDVYVDSLHALIERITGLYTSIKPRGNHNHA
jgi:hypothetical protein